MELYVFFVFHFGGRPQWDQQDGRRYRECVRCKRRGNEGGGMRVRECRARKKILQRIIIYDRYETHTHPVGITEMVNELYIFGGCPHCTFLAERSAPRTDNADRGCYAMR